LPKRMDSVSLVENPEMGITNPSASLASTNITNGSGRGDHTRNGKRVSRADHPSTRKNKRVVPQWESTDRTTHSWRSSIRQQRLLDLDPFMLKTAGPFSPLHKLG